MGEDAFSGLELNYKIVYTPENKENKDVKESKDGLGLERLVFTSAEDTKRACEKMLAESADLILFCGGDGTARDVYSVVDKKIPILGIPAGVKMHSSVFALTPESAAHVLAKYVKGNYEIKEGEIADIDEEMYRKGEFNVRLYGYCKTLSEPQFVQCTKTIFESAIDEDDKIAIAIHMKEMMEEIPGIYILGPGTTTEKIAEEVGLEKTLLGVDIVISNGKEKKTLAKDADEETILKILEENRDKDKFIVISPIGKQGFIFGRGNQQISAKVISQVGTKNIILISTREKLFATEKLHVDTGDKNLDNELKGFRKIICGYRHSILKRIE
jgi:predicted polyphosphate/ATP-dependent NAD kinase